MEAATRVTSGGAGAAGPLEDEEGASDGGELVELLAGGAEGVGALVGVLSPDMLRRVLRMEADTLALSMRRA